VSAMAYIAAATAHAHETREGPVRGPVTVVYTAYCSIFLTTPL
jgi:hypothetical protein